jgi:hypothetical protein
MDLNKNISDRTLNAARDACFSSKHWNSVEFCEKFKLKYFSCSRNDKTEIILPFDISSHDLIFKKFYFISFYFIFFSFHFFFFLFVKSFFSLEYFSNVFERKEIYLALVDRDNSVLFQKINIEIRSNLFEKKTTENSNCGFCASNTKYFPK